MTGKELLEDMEYIDAKWIEEAAFAKTKKKTFIRNHKGYLFSVLATAVVCLAVGVTVIWKQRDGRIMESATETAVDTAACAISENEAADTDIDDINDTEEEAVIETTTENTHQYDYLIEEFLAKQEQQSEIKDNAAEVVSDMLPTNAGTYFYSKELGEALQYYKECQGVYAFRVRIDVFGTCEEDDGNETFKELRLQQDGEKLIQKEYERLKECGYEVSLSGDHIMTGIFTQEELENFEICESYGYLLDFAE